MTIHATSAGNILIHPPGARYAERVCLQGAAAPFYSSTSACSQPCDMSVPRLPLLGCALALQLVTVHSSRTRLSVQDLWEVIHGVVAGDSGAPILAVQLQPPRDALPEAKGIRGRRACSVHGSAFWGLSATRRLNVEAS